MRGRQIRPAQVMQTARVELEFDLMGRKNAYRPPWFHVVSSIPPAEKIVRTIPVQHREQGRKKSWTSRHLYRPQQIVYAEDALRTKFYKDHPWELARPRIVVESDGKDSQLYDWSTGVRQPGMALSGECVVQRQLWLMESQNMSQNKAYDVARHEFYKLRQAEEIERRIAVEEARYVGAYFGRTRNEVSMLIENHAFENWKAWAAKELAAREMALAAHSPETIDTTADHDATTEDEAFDIADLAEQGPA